MESLHRALAGHGLESIVGGMKGCQMVGRRIGEAWQ
jgi:hypothetical protein